MATVRSGGKAIHFLIGDGRRIAREAPAPNPSAGSHVVMTFDWPPETIADLDRYFDFFLVPAGVQLMINGRAVARRGVRFVVEAQLTTEIYNAATHAWQKPRRKTTIELVDARDGEEPFLYEMGIPVASAEWCPPKFSLEIMALPTGVEPVFSD